MPLPNGRHSRQPNPAAPESETLPPACVRRPGNVQGSQHQPGPSEPRSLVGRRAAHAQGRRLSARRIQQPATSTPPIQPTSKKRSARAARHLSRHRHHRRKRHQRQPRDDRTSRMRGRTLQFPCAHSRWRPSPHARTRPAHPPIRVVHQDLHRARRMARAETHAHGQSLAIDHREVLTLTAWCATRPTCSSGRTWVLPSNGQPASPRRRAADKWSRSDASSETPPTLHVRHRLAGW